jgi:hypothetical protein
MALGRSIGVALSALALSAPAGAGVQLYSAELIVHTRGSDVAGDFIGIPFGAHCNTLPYHAEQTLMFHTGMNVHTLTFPKFGGQLPVIDTDSDSVPDVPAGCAPASAQLGLPLSGGGSLATTGDASTSRSPGDPRGFNMPASAVARATSGASLPRTTGISLPYAFYLFDFEIEYADLRNAAGGFAKGGGPGDFFVSHGAKAQVTAGKNQFGGTMRLLGHYRTNRGLVSLDDKSIAATTWNLHYLGAGAQTSMGDVTRGRTYTAMTLRPYYYPGRFDYSPRTVTVFPWTTGTAQVTALSGPQATVLERAGYDNRTPNGAGTIQMVSPMLARWTNSFGDFHTGSIGVLKLQFVPEPGAWSMLVAGSAALGLLYRANRGPRAPR